MIVLLRRVNSMYYAYFLKYVRRSWWSEHKCTNVIIIDIIDGMIWEVGSNRDQLVWFICH
jgi:hypothetical protein